MVIPTTACTGPSGVAERGFLAERFHIETIVTSHDPRRPNFSENTAIHESLLICRRRAREDVAVDRPTRFVSLRTMPSTAAEAVRGGRSHRGGHCRQMAHRSRTTRVVHPEGRLAAVPVPGPGARWRCDASRTGDRGLVPLRDRYLLGPAGQRIRDAFRPVDDDGDGYRVFWGRSKDLRTTMAAAPEQAVADRKPALAARLPATGGACPGGGEVQDGLRSAARDLQRSSSSGIDVGSRPGLPPRAWTRRRRCAHGATVRLERSDS